MLAIELIQKLLALGIPSRGEPFDFLLTAVTIDLLIVFKAKLEAGRKLND